eukprot:scaffold51031_cov63-Attheya_sp.AAC.3
MRKPVSKEVPPNFYYSVLCANCLHNELIAPPDQGGLLGARHHEFNDVIISDTMLCSLVPPRLRPVTDHHKIMCGCTICNTSKYLQTSLNAWRRKHMKYIEVQANASRSWAKATTNLFIHVAKMQLILCFVHQQLNAAYPIANVFYAPVQIICSHHGVVILDKVTYYLDAKGGKKKKTCWFCEQLIQAKKPDFERGRLYEKAFTATPDDISTRSDYAGFTPHGQLQSEY